MKNNTYQYEVASDLYTIYSVNVTTVNHEYPTSNNEQSKTFKFKTIGQALSFIDNIWRNDYSDIEDEFFNQSLVVRTNIMRSGKLITE